LEQKVRKKKLRTISVSYSMRVSIDTLLGSIDTLLGSIDTGFGPKEVHDAFKFRQVKIFPIRLSYLHY